MIVDLKQILFISTILISFAEILKSAEFLQIERLLRPLSPSKYQENALLRALLYLRIVAAAALLSSAVFSLLLPLLAERIGPAGSADFLSGAFFSGGLFALLFFTSVYLSLYWGGNFNGGSDSMSSLILGILLLCSLAQNEKIRTAAIWYLALQTCFSYFTSGVAKALEPSWRNGNALEQVLRSALPMTGGEVPPFLIFLSKRKMFITGLLLFEIGFPASLSRPSLALTFIATGMIFHLANVYAFGLNRFFWAWLAAYPSIFFCSQFVLVRI